MESPPLGVSSHSIIARLDDAFLGSDDLLPCTTSEQLAWQSARRPANPQLDTRVPPTWNLRCVGKTGDRRLPGRGRFYSLRHHARARVVLNVRSTAATQNLRTQWIFHLNAMRDDGTFISLGLNGDLHLAHLLARPVLAEAGLRYLALFPAVLALSARLANHRPSYRVRMTSTTFRVR